MKKLKLIIFLFLVILINIIHGGVVAQKILNSRVDYAKKNNLIDIFSIDQKSNILQEDNFGIANGKITIGVKYNDLINVKGLWAPPLVSSDFSIEATIDGLSIVKPDYKWYPFYVYRNSMVNPNIYATSNTLLIPNERAGIISLTIENKSSDDQLIPIILKIKGSTLDYIKQNSLDIQYWGFGQQTSETQTIKRSISSDLIIQHRYNCDGFTNSDIVLAVNGNTIYSQNGKLIIKGKISKTTLEIVSTFLCKDFSETSHLFAASGDTVYWQSNNQVRRGIIENGILNVDTSFSFNGFSVNDRLFAFSGNKLYWQSRNQLRSGTISNCSLIPDPSFVIDVFSDDDRLFAISGKNVFWQNENTIYQGEISYKLTNNGSYLYYLKDVSMIYNGFAKGDKVLFFTDNNIYWSSTGQLSSGFIKSGSAIKIEQGIYSVIISTCKNLTWDAIHNVFSGSLLLPSSGKANVNIGFSIGKTSEALALCNNIISNPELSFSESKKVYNQRINDLFHKLPQFESNNTSLTKFYYRSLTPLLINRWEVPEFKLNPYYSTGSINGGCLGNYLWNFGESMEILSLYDPEATKAHIKQFLETGVEKGFGFRPLYGQMLEHNYFYPINQRKIIGLTYNYIKNTGDIAFLNETRGNSTILDEIISQALFLDDTTKPVSLVDYNICDPQKAGGASHLELRSERFIYRYIMPDLNGRRYLNYENAAELSQLAGKPRLDLLKRAESLKKILKAELWDSTSNWFKYEDSRTNIKDLRYTVQMFFLLGSNVLDQDQVLGLVSHLNENEFLSEYGLHSLSKKEIGLAYDPNDIDNGGPGICTSFPLNIAKKLYLIGNSQKAEDILSRILWWGEKTPYLGDSFYADRQDYRHETPLQCTIDGVSGAQCIIFGMFGITARFDGTILINPKPPFFANKISLKGVKMLNKTFDIFVNNGTYVVVYNKKRLKVSVGQPIVIENNLLAIEKSKD